MNENKLYNYAFTGILVRIDAEEKKLKRVKNIIEREHLKRKIFKMKLEAEYIRHKI